MNIRYQEESEYGQLVLDLIAMISSLTEDNAIYNKKTIVESLEECRGQINVIIHLVKISGASFFDGGE